MTTLKFGTPSGTEFNVKCKSGSYINNFYGSYNKYLEVLGASCSDGKDLGSVGRSTNILGHGDTWKTIEAGSQAPGGPYNTFNVGFNKHLIQFNNLKGSDTIVQGQTSTCPTGAAVGIGGTFDGSYINSLTIQCEAPSSYCYNHIEDPMCADADKDALNMSCGTKWTPICTKRAKELNEALVASHCKQNPNEPLCSCYGEVPKYVPAKLVQTPQCWNAECAAVGYIPSSAGSNTCPNITIGTNDLRGVDIDTLSSNIKIVTGATPVNAKPEMAKSTILLFILIYVGCFAGLAAYIWYYYVRKVNPNDILILNQESSQEPVDEADVDPEADSGNNVDSTDY